MTRALALVCLAVLPAAFGTPALAKKIDIGDGVRLRVVQKGKGVPTVVFDAGLGDSLESWRWVWPDVAKFTRVFLYDRAGLGRSDAGPPPRTSRRVIDELHRLLEAAQARPPYVLVGHSLGGLHLRLFASEYPDEVAGLILIDATPVDFPGREAGLRTEFERRKLETLMQIGPVGLRHERAAVELSVEQVRASTLPEVPVVVISSTRAGDSERFRAAWLEMQKQMARALGAERHVVTGDSGHYIQFDEPQLVVEAIRSVVQRSRP